MKRTIPLLFLLTATLAFATDYVGQAFITGAGGVGQNKFAGMRVAAYPLKDALEQVNRVSPSMPKPLTDTTTDADGRFKFNVEDNTPFLLCASGTFNARNGRVVPFRWQIKSTDIEDPSAVMLTDRNCERDPQMQLR